MDFKCSEYNASIGSRNLKKLRQLRQRKSLSLCLELLEECGISGDEAVFILGEVGGEG
ncbi:MAG TPA: hypothetical protein V6D35_00275 [Candidatus Sericytochromatia bacterium]|jgi:hypothetical protein